MNAMIVIEMGNLNVRSRRAEEGGGGGGIGTTLISTSISVSGEGVDQRARRIE